jgi:subtilase family serine protease
MRWLLLLTLTSCAVDVETDSESQDLTNCPECDPGDTSGQADLAPGPALDPCHFVYTDGGRKIGVRVFNNGDAAAPASTARVQFRVSYNNTLTAPVDVSFPSLEPNTSATRYLMANTYCWNSLPGCDIYVSSDAGNAVAESNETNNKAAWHCSK